MNPTLVWDVLTRLRIEWMRSRSSTNLSTAPSWPDHGLARIQWHGPWMEPKVPRRARYRHTHWVAARRSADGHLWIFDINCMVVGGWVGVEEWQDQVAPWLIQECCPKGDGGWSITDSIEISGRDGLPDEAWASGGVRL